MRRLALILSVAAVLAGCGKKGPPLPPLLPYPVEAGPSQVRQAGAEMEENWQAFFNAVALFRKTAKTVGEGLGYEYPLQVDREMTEYYSRIRSTKKETANNRIQRAAGR